MMKANHFVFLLFITMIGFSCKKDKDIAPSNTNGAFFNSFTLKKDGVPYTAGKVYITSSETSEYIGIEAHLSAAQVNIETYSMSLNKHIQPGTYNENNSPISLNSICAFIHIYQEQHVFIMDDGEITILLNDTVSKVIEFNFKFNLYEDLGPGLVNITEGHCKVHY